MSKQQRPKQEEISQKQLMWGGRFSAQPSEIMRQINESISVDQRLYREDIAGSLVHVEMLAKQGIIASEEAQQITAGLRQVEQELAEGKLEFRSELEDIHMHIEARLTDLIGPIAGKLHTARSRNDQVATDFRLWVRHHCDLLLEEIACLQTVLEQHKASNINTIMPGFTHLQVAMPVTFASHLDVYYQMLSRDCGRIQDCRTRLNECPLGAGALAGSSYPLDRVFTASKLGFKQPMANTMDAVSDRDFALEYLAALSILATHLSRLGEELVLWSSYQFQFIQLQDEFTTGSSMMPQKRNPDAAELLRGKAGQVIASLTQLFIVLKGLPLTYSKDMQDDKKPVFEATDTVLLCLRAATGMLSGMKVHKENMLRAVQQGYANATYLADWLVLQFGIPFRRAHHIVGCLVARAEKLNVKLEELPPEIFQEELKQELQEQCPSMDGQMMNSLYKALDYNTK